MAEEKVLNIEELQQDDKNFNAGTEEGQRMMEKSFSELGAGRSILIDKNGKIIGQQKPAGGNSSGHQEGASH